MRTRFLAALDRFNREHPWSHNDAYARVVVRRARTVRRSGGRRALDIGCGTGTLVVRLARELPEVVGVDADASMARLAWAAVADVPGAHIEHGRFPFDGPGQFDLVSMVAVLHHMPLQEALHDARGVLAPGGRLVVVGAYRETPADLPFSLVSLVLNPVVGWIRHPERADRVPRPMTAPTKEPEETFVEIREAMQLALPGVRVRRGLFWRYVATWEAPSRQTTGSLPGTACSGGRADSSCRHDEQPG